MQPDPTLQERPRPIGRRCASAMLCLLLAAAAATQAGLPPPAPSARLPSLFTGFANRPLWLDADGRPTPQALTLAAELDRIEDRGLDGADYGDPDWPARVAALLGGDADDAARFRFEFEFSVALMQLAQHLHRGRVDPRPLGFEFDAAAAPLDLDRVLLELARAEAPAARLTALEPRFPGHRRLRAALLHYRTLAATTDRIDLPPLPARTVDPGARWSGITLLAHRLVQLGDLDAAALPRYRDRHHDRYEGALVDAVERFQRRHGLATDGRIGARTLAALETPMSRRVEQIRLALERWRWTPVEPAQAPIVVNIPEFRLRAFDAEGGVAFESDVVVGMAFQRQTPVFAGPLRYVVFQPTWHVPASIVRRDLVPRAQKDPAYLERQGYEIVGGAALPTFAALDALERGALRLQQRPGPRNSLGRVKFLFPNEHNVYLHDTPSTALFERARRDFSSGCIRVRDPAGLAAWVLRRQPGWSPERVEAALAGGPGDQTVTVDAAIPVVLVYMTAVATEDGDIRFFDDIYGHDETLQAALATRGEPLRIGLAARTPRRAGS